MGRQVRILSLFSGIGGLELGLELSGVGETLWQVEQDPFCRKVLAQHWPNAQRFEDVRTVRSADFIGAEVIAGGFPCQDISNAGKRAGLVGESSGLWWEMFRLIREIRPAFVVVENVLAIANRGLGQILGALASCGYDAEWDCISAAIVGAQHRRNRLFIVAWLPSNTDGEPLRNHQQRQARGRNNIQNSGDAFAAYDGDSGLPANPNGQRARQFQRRKQEVIRWPTDGGAAFDFNPWNASAAVCPVVDGFSGRMVMLKALGNSVVPQVAYYAGQKILEVLRAKNG